MISKPKSQSVCLLLLAEPRDILMPLLPLHLLLHILEMLHVVPLLLVFIGVLMIPEVKVDVMAPVLLIGVLVAAAHDECLVVGHSWRCRKKHHLRRILKTSFIKKINK